MDIQKRKAALAILAIGSIIPARLLGPENYGLFSPSLVVPSILVGFLDLDVRSALVRFSAKFRAEGKQKRLQWGTSP